MKNRKIAVKRVTETVNVERPDKYHSTPHTVGRKLSALGFQKAKTNNGAAAIIYDDQLIERLKAKYGIGQSSVSSVAQSVTEDNTNLTDDTDVSLEAAGEPPF